MRAHTMRLTLTADNNPGVMHGKALDGNNSLRTKWCSVHGAAASRPQAERQGQASSTVRQHGRKRAA
jgi:hypothetical protein